MANIYDVALYILNKQSPISTMKLQKLCYYCQAWSLVWDEEVLFNEDFKAWANGPVNIELYILHKGHFKIDASLLEPYGNIDNLSTKQIETIDTVLKDYGDKTGYFLSQLSHSEDPWADMRIGLGPLEPSKEIISKDSMYEYYSSL